MFTMNENPRMEIPFYKMEGAGNDYIYINDIEEKLPDLSNLAIKISNRHHAIGSDGLIVVRSSKKADFMMRMFNVDGSEGKMCGNGIRCLAKFVYDNHLTGKTSLEIETLSGIKQVELIRDEATNEVTRAIVDMGPPILQNSKIPIHSTEKHWLNHSLEVNDEKYKVTSVSMGNPHVVTYMDEIHHLDLSSIGPHFEHHPQFPEQMNTEFIKVVSLTELDMRVWERGSGETLACGTGACAAVVASVLNQSTDNQVTVNLLGGQLDIHWDRENSGHLFMEGPVNTTFKGTYFFNRKSEAYHENQ